MRYLVRFLSICGLVLIPFIGCGDFLGDWESPDPCEGVNCDDGNPCTRDYCPSFYPARCEHDPVPDGRACSVDGLSGVCKDGVCDLCEGVECENGVCLNGVCVVDQCTADDLAAIEAGDGPDDLVLMDCAVAAIGADCINSVTACLQNFGTTLTTECSSCFALEACCVWNECFFGPCTPEPGDACDMCIQECQSLLDACVGGQ